MASFLSVSEAAAVSAAVFRSGRREDLLPPAADALPAAASDIAPLSVDAFWNTWFAPDTPAAPHAPRRFALGESWRVSASDFADSGAAPPERPALPDVAVELSEYEYESDPDAPATPAAASPPPPDAPPLTPVTPESEVRRRLLAEEEEERRSEEASRRAEEELRRIVEERQRTEAAAALAEEEARRSAVVRMEQEAIASLTEQRPLPDRRVSSWTPAEPKKSILKNRHSFAPIVHASAPQAAAPAEKEDAGDADGSDAHGADALDALGEYDSGSSVGSRRQSMASLMSRRASSTRRASEMAPKVVGVANSRRKSGRPSRRSTAGNQMGGGMLVDYDSSPSMHSRKFSSASPGDPEQPGELSEEEAEVSPAALERMRKNSEAAPPPQILERGTMIRESMGSGIEVRLEPEVKKPGFVNCAIQCSGEEIDAEISIMFAKYTLVSQSGADIPPIEPQVEPDAAAVEPKTPVAGDEKDKEDAVEPEPKIRFAEQRVEVETPGQTITYESTKSIIPDPEDNENMEDGIETDEAENRLSIKDGDLRIIELSDEQKRDTSSEKVAKPTEEKENEEEAPAKQTEGIDGSGTPKATCSIQKSIGVDIPQSGGRSTPFKKRKTPVRSGGRSSGRRSRRTSSRAGPIAQELNFNDASPQVPSSMKRRSSRLQGAEPSDEVVEPVPVDKNRSQTPTITRRRSSRLRGSEQDQPAFQSSVMKFEIPQAKKKGKRHSRFVYKGKSFHSNIAEFGIEPQESESGLEDEDESNFVDIISPGPSTRSQAAKRKSAVRVEESSSSRVTRSETKSQPSALHSERSRVVKGRSNRERKGVSFPALTSVRRSKKRAASEVSPPRVTRGVKKRVSEANANTPISDHGGDGYDDDFDNDVVEDDVEINNSRAERRARRSSLRSAGTIEADREANDVIVARRARRSSLRSAGTVEEDREENEVRAARRTRRSSLRSAGAVDEEVLSLPKSPFPAVRKRGITKRSRVNSRKRGGEGSRTSREEMPPPGTEGRRVTRSSLRSGGSRLEDSFASPVRPVSNDRSRKKSRGGSKQSGREASAQSVERRVTRSSKRSGRESADMPLLSVDDDVEVVVVEASPAISEQSARRVTRSSLRSGSRSSITIGRPDVDVDDDIIEVAEATEQPPRRSTRSSRRSAQSAGTGRGAASTRSEASVAASAPVAPVAAAKGGRKSKGRGGRDKKATSMSRELRSLAAKAFEPEEGEDQEIRRSKRQRFPTLRFWQNEKIVYERRKSQVLPTIAQVMVAIPAEGGEESESSTASWLARGQIPLRTAENEAQSKGKSNGKGGKRGSRKRTRAG